MTLPTLLVRGERSPRPTQRVCETLDQVMPYAKLFTIQGAGHMAPLTHGDQVNDLIAAYLNSGGRIHEANQHRLFDSRRGLRELRAGAR
jgi:pimeloyl-ACP methyl ester carboxylesterase